MNLFRYCGDDPVDRSDPMGLADIAVSSELELYGVMAAINSYRAVHAARDGLGRAQLVIARGTHFQLGAKSTAEIKPETPIFGKLSKGAYQTESYGASELAGAKAVGHVHTDVTGRPGKTISVFSQDDQITTQRGTVVYKINESDPSQVQRLAPQRDGSRPNAQGNVVSRKLVDAARKQLDQMQHQAKDSFEPTAADVDRGHQATGVPGLGAEAVNFAPGKS
jgi:hypothetical protein